MVAAASCGASDTTFAASPALTEPPTDLLRVAATRGGEAKLATRRQFR
jgi:hypothetical protein